MGMPENIAHMGGDAGSYMDFNSPAREVLPSMS